MELRLRKNTREYSEGYRGAFVTVLVRCNTPEEFVQAAVEHVGREGFDVAGVELLFPLSFGRFAINDTIEELVDRTNEYPVQWTTFDLFKDDA